MCSIQVKLTLFRSYCSPLIKLYTAQLWWSYKKSSMSKLIVSYHNIPSRYLNSGYPENRGIFPKAAHARTINAMMHFLGFPERVVADDRRHKYEASGCGSHK